MVALAIACLLIIGGVFEVTRYVERIAWTKSSHVHLQHGLAGMNRDLSITDDAHEDISPHDLPLDTPAHREVLRQIREAEDQLPAHKRGTPHTWAP